MAIATPLDPVEALRAAHAGALLDVHTFRNETTLIVDPAQLVTVMHYLRDTAGLIYNFLSDISAVDYYPDYTRPGRFAVAYHLYSMLYNRRVRVKVYLPEEAPKVPSVVNVWPVANWLEREAHDMMGIEFDGHPDLRRLLMPDDWQGHPQRRD